MRKFFFGLLAVVLLLLVLLGAELYTTFGGLVPLAAETDGDLTTAVDGIVGVSIVDTGRGAILVDCGADTEGAAIFEALSARDLGAEDVKAVLITHGHIDHIGACHRFPEAKIYALAAEVAHIEGREKPLGPLPRLMPLSPRPFVVTDPLEDGQKVSIAGAKVEAFHLPGHTAGAAAYRIGDTLFLGDSAALGADGVLRGAPWLFSDDVDQSDAALVALAKRLTPQADRIQRLVFSHSGPADRFDPLRQFKP